jgi:hypothetical protein
MNYDRDIRWARRIAWFLVLANLGAGILNMYVHNWTVAIACFVWCFSSCLVLAHTRIHQATRDLGRTIEAGLHAMREEMEKY